VDSVNKYLVAFAAIVMGLLAWGGYKLFEQHKGASDAKLDKAYHDQRDSTQAWKELYKSTEAARANLHDSLNILGGMRAQAEQNADAWHQAAVSAKRKVNIVPRPSERDSTNPQWMERALMLEQVVAAQDKELSEKSSMASIDSAKIRLLLSQLSKDSVALHSANDNIDRLNHLVEAFKDKSECHILFKIPCPSRFQSYVAGGATVLAVVLLKDARN
jgi:hypothetical protein